MYPAMEDFRVDITLGEGAGARTVNMKLRPFTLIGATTRSGLLSAPLRDRFQIREHLEFYSVEELTEIVRRNAAKLRVEIDDAAAAKDRPLQPRHAAHRQQPPPLGPRLLDQQGRRPHHARRSPRRRSTCSASTSWASTRRTASTWKRSLRVFHGGPAGVEAIAHTMNAALDTLVDEVEPFLLRSELVVRTPRGRKLTARAYEHLGATPPDRRTRVAAVQVRLSYQLSARPSMANREASSDRCTLNVIAIAMSTSTFVICMLLPF